MNIVKIFTGKDKYDINEDIKVYQEVNNLNPINTSISFIQKSDYGLSIVVSVTFERLLTNQQS